ncbi:MAG: pentapeptide repeat-containing protein [Okeania sp. SIO2H7]|nr:pentapeptide repeat-containing protein [Okeania sp. SIO2H7]
MSKIYRITLEELLERYADGQRDFTRFTIRYTDREFENGIDLRGVKFRGDSLSRLVYALQNSNLSGADLRSINLHRLGLDRCNLSGALLNKADLWRTCFHKANLSGANLTGANLQEVSFTYANLRKANLSDTKLIETYFGCADLSGANFTNTNIGGIDFSRANLTEVDFTKASIGDTWNEKNFKNCFFQNTIMPDGSIRSS